MLVVHLEQPSARTLFVVRHVLERMLGLAVHYAHGAAEFRSANGPRLSYGKERFEGAFNIPFSGMIDELPEQDPEVIVDGDTRRMFLVNGEADLFAGVFYLLSLTDEIRCTVRDAHGRVPSAALFTVRNGLADRPWIDEQVIKLGIALENEWPGELHCALRYSNCVTVDMDNILRYAGRPFSRALGASVKDLLHGEWSAVPERWRVRSGNIPDPFERAIEVVAAQRETFRRAILFYLLRGEGEFDHAADPSHPATQAHIRRCAEAFDVGIHPSYGSSVKGTLQEEERAILQQTINKDVRLSRQHFLRWQLPGTLRYLGDAGYVEDHTLGFTDRAGFRVGTCRPFPWYDLEGEQETRLMLHPFAVMDSALIEQQRMDPHAVVKAMNAMSDKVRAVSGQFISVWHDRYLSGHREFAPWPDVFEQVMQHARP